MNASSKPGVADLNIVEMTIADVQQGFRDGRFSAESLAEAHLARIRSI